MNLSVLQWNIWFKEDIENVARTLKEIDADVVCLQELTKHYAEQSRKDTVAYIAKELGFQVYASEPMGRDDVERRQFNAIFSRFALSDQNQAWINTPIGIGGPSDEFRAYVEASIQIGGKKIRIATTHMSYVDRFEMTDRKKQETDRLVQQIEHKSLLIFTGDCNADPESYTISQIERHVRNVGPDYSQKTWTTKPFKHHDFEETELNWRLDYVFATPDLKVISSEIIETPYSDHLPILTKFSVGS